jgi:hypothetical protein
LVGKGSDYQTDLIFNEHDTHRPIEWIPDDGPHMGFALAGIWSAPAEGGTTDDGALDQPIPR